jgi:hypothetical protein
VQSGSGPFGGSWIYLAIAVMWAVVLIPMWLKRHDEAQESKSADRFAKAMTSLRRGRERRDERPAREVLMPTRPRTARGAEVTVTGPRAGAGPAARAAARRRRTLLALAGLLSLTLLLAALGAVPLLVSAVPALLLSGFVVVARRQVVAAAELRRRQQRRAVLSEAARAAQSQHRTGRSDARRGGRVVDPAPADAHPASEQRATGTDAWNPVPTTLPTYVTAPRATKMPRVIDLTHPGAWSGAAMLEQARGTLASEPVADGEMRVETFEITVPRDAPDVVPQSARYRPENYADRYIEDDVALDSLEPHDELDTLLDDPRSGVELPTWRRAANE